MLVNYLAHILVEVRNRIELQVGLVVVEHKVVDKWVVVNMLLLFVEDMLDMLVVADMLWVVVDM